MMDLALNLTNLVELAVDCLVGTFSVPKTFLSLQKYLSFVGCDKHDARLDGSKESHIEVYDLKLLKL